MARETKGTVKIEGDSVSRKHAEEYKKVKDVEKYSEKVGNGKVKFFERRVLENGVVKTKLVDLHKDGKSILYGKK